MSREILFRGQTRRKGERVNMNGEPLPSIWVYGGVFLSKRNFSVIYKGVFRRESPVYTDTVDQFTGATDKNDVKIFENDILEYESDGEITHGLVIYDKYTAQYCVCDTDGKLNSRFRIGNECTVVGNFHDDPELLNESQFETHELYCAILD